MKIYKLCHSSWEINELLGEYWINADNAISKLEKILKDNNDLSNKLFCLNKYKEIKNIQYSFSTEKACTCQYKKYNRISFKCCAEGLPYSDYKSKEEVVVVKGKRYTRIISEEIPSCWEPIEEYFVIDVYEIELNE